MANLNFQQSLLWSSVSHDASEIILMCCLHAQETFIIIYCYIYYYYIENSCAA